jgi:hypothetical protein
MGGRRRAGFQPAKKEAVGDVMEEQEYIAPKDGQILRLRCQPKKD